MVRVLRDWNAWLKQAFSHISAKDIQETHQGHMKIFVNQTRNQAKAIVSKSKNLNSTVGKKSAKKKKSNFGSLLHEDFFYIKTN